MKFFAILNERGVLVPVYNSDVEEKRKLKPGDYVQCERWKQRNVLFHKKFFALIRIGCENSKSVDMPVDAYYKYAVIKAGYSKIYKTPKGLFVDAESIAFNNMDEDKFEEVYNNVLDFVIKDTGADKKFIENNLLNFM